jgi:hypothetical protein
MSYLCTVSKYSTKEILNLDMTAASEAKENSLIISFFVCDVLSRALLFERRASELRIYVY